METKRIFKNLSAEKIWQRRHGRLKNINIKHKSIQQNCNQESFLFLNSLCNRQLHIRDTKLNPHKV